MSKNISINLESVKKSFLGSFKWLNRYRNILFFLLLTSLYGYIIWRINVLSTAPPSTTDVVSAQQNTETPQISADTVQKLQNLQDNSVRVQSLFNDARQNPFQE